MLVSLNNVIKKYPPSFELFVNKLEICEQEIIGIVGNNGAGKTTLLKSILDLIKLDKGEVYIDNFSVCKSHVWKKITGAYLDQSFVIDFLTPLEYFELIGNLYKLNREKLHARLGKYSNFLSSDLFIKKSKLIRELSTGNKQKVGITGAFIVEPKLLVLDEPHANLDPRSQLMLKNYLNELNDKNGTTVVLSSHNLNFVSEVCDRIILMENGKIIKDEKVRANTLNELEEYFKKQVIAEK